MSGAGETLVAAAMAALDGAAGIGTVHDGAPLQAVLPYALVECGPESDWSHKTGEGRELRLAVTVRDGGERPRRLRALMSGAEAAIEELPAELDGWRLVSLSFMRSRTVAEGRGKWAGVSEYRARMLRSQAVQS